MTITRAFSAGVESSTKSGRARRVPLADEAGAALERLSRRQDFVSDDDLVLCNAFGRPIDASALRCPRLRFFPRVDHENSPGAAGLRSLRWHDLRHTFGSLLVAGGVDLVSVKDAMGRSQLTTTSRYLQARPALSARQRSPPHSKRRRPA